MNDNSFQAYKYASSVFPDIFSTMNPRTSELYPYVPEVGVEPCILCMCIWRLTVAPWLEFKGDSR